LEQNCFISSYEIYSAETPASLLQI